MRSPRYIIFLCTDTSRETRMLGEYPLKLAVLKQRVILVHKLKYRRVWFQEHRISLMEKALPWWKQHFPGGINISLKKEESPVGINIYLEKEVFPFRKKHLHGRRWKKKYFSDEKISPGMLHHIGRINSSLDEAVSPSRNQHLSRGSSYLPGGRGMSLEEAVCPSRNQHLS